MIKLYSKNVIFIKILKKNKIILKNKEFFVLISKLSNFFFIKYYNKLKTIIILLDIIIKILDYYDYFGCIKSNMPCATPTVPCESININSNKFDKFILPILSLQFLLV